MSLAFARAFIVVLLSSNLVFACPQLEGSYTCNLSGGTIESLNIHQDVKDGVTVYEFNGSETILADNKISPLPDTTNLKSGTIRAWCDKNDQLKMQIKGEFWNKFEPEQAMSPSDCAKYKALAAARHVKSLPCGIGDLNDFVNKKGDLGEMIIEISVYFAGQELKQTSVVELRSAKISTTDDLICTKN